MEKKPATHCPLKTLHQNAFYLFQVASECQIQFEFYLRSGRNSGIVTGVCVARIQMKTSPGVENRKKFSFQIMNKT